MAPQSEEVARPLAVVDSLFQRCISLDPEAPVPAEWGERAHFARELGLLDEESFAKIPCLNDAALAESVPPFSLVRYRGFVQDLFEPEIYAARVREVNADEGVAAQGRIVTTKYREVFQAAPGHRLVELGRDGFGQRGACYCVPCPGEMPWARGSAVGSTSPTPRGTKAERAPVLPPGTPPKAAKRSRPTEDAEMEGEEETAGKRSQAAEERQAAVADVGAEAQCRECNADEFGLNFPLPWEEQRGQGFSTACIVKLYDGDEEAVKLCDTVEIVGILCINPEIANLSDLLSPHDSVLGSDARQPSTALVPRLHAIFIRKLPFQHPLLPYTPAWLTEERLAAAFQRSFAAGALTAARNAAKEHLVRHLGGDALAAEYALMLLASRSFDRRGGLALGSWTLNLAGVPPTADLRGLCQGIGELAPRVAHLELSEDLLSSRRWQPRKDFVANRLLAGQMQLAQGTVLLLDERQLTASDQQRAEAPAKSLEAVRSVVSRQTLPCEYGNYDVDIPVEILCIAVSQQRSKVAQGLADVTLPLRPTSEMSAAAGPAGASEVADLRAARMLLGLVTRSPRPLKIPDDVAERFSQDFVAAREEMPQLPAELCHSWMALARAHCLTHGEEELTMERWLCVLGLERERLQRCRQQNLLVLGA